MANQVVPESTFLKSVLMSLFYSTCGLATVLKGQLLNTLQTCFLHQLFAGNINVIVTPHHQIVILVVQALH